MSLHHDDRSTSAAGPPRTTAELALSGMTRRELDAHLRSGELRRVTRGVYLESGSASAAHSDDHDQRRQRHLLLARSVMLALPDAYLVGSSACLAHGLPVWALPETVHLARSGRLRSTRREVSAHRGWPHAVVDAGGLRAQPPAAAITQTAADEGILPALVSADAAARTGSSLDTTATLEQFGHRPGSARARTTFALADHRRESPLETWTAWQAHLCGIALEPQQVIRDECGEWIATVDFVVTGLNVVVEVDGIGKYTRHSDFKNERVRHNQIEELGWIVVRVTFDDLRAGRFVPRLRAALARSLSRS